MNKKQLEGISLWLRIFYLHFQVYKNQWCFKICLIINFQNLMNMLLLIILLFHVKLTHCDKKLKSYCMNYLESSVILLFFLSVLKHCCL